MFSKPTPPPVPLKLDWQPTKGRALTTWLPDDEFDVIAKKHNMQGKDGFALRGQWWKKHPEIYVRARCMAALFMHEVRHVEEGPHRNFHGGDDHA